MTERAPDLYVDLDGTLIHGDLFVEAMLRYVLRAPWRVFTLFFWLLQGRSRAKTLLARHMPLDPAALPYRRELIAYLQTERQGGRRIVLATASHWRYAHAVARHLGLFDRVIATHARRNAKGRRKCALIEADSGGRFAYAGDSPADRPIWSAAESVVMVNAPRGDERAAQAAGKLERSFREPTSMLKAIFRAMRPHQWAKNALVFLPLLTAHLYGHAPDVLAALWAFAAFSLIASGSYLVNDLADLDADRLHPKKRHRPLAAGLISPVLGGLLALTLLAAGFGVGLLFLPAAFTLSLGAYLLITLAYSFKLKRLATVDVITLAGLYTLRVIAGAAAISVTPTFWLLAFSMFLFLSLAFLKRYSELAGKTPEDDADMETALHGRGYSPRDTETTFILGAVNGNLSVLVMALYINAPEVGGTYATPELLWAICPALLYWINRIWVCARRGWIDEDPVYFAVRDRNSLLTALICLAAVIAAKSGL